MYDPNLRVIQASIKFYGNCEYSKYLEKLIQEEYQKIIFSSSHTSKNQKNLKDGLKHLLIHKIINTIVIVNVGYIQECYVEVSSLKIIYKH